MADSPTRYALVVDDDPAWQEIIGEILRDAGLFVDLASSAGEAEQLLQRRPHRVAVVDLALGAGGAANQEGLQVLRAAQRQDPGCATILLTGYATVALAVDVLTAYGALSCLTKANFDRAEFQHLISQVRASAPSLDRTPDDPSAPDREMGASPDLVPIQYPILVVDDDAGWRSILSELLTDAGYRARVCNSYGEALGCLRRDRYAVAVVDLALSDRGRRQTSDHEPDGYCLLEEARAADIVTVVVSGVAHAEEIAQIYERYEPFAYLEKQAFDRRAFLQAIAEACESHSLSPALSTLTPRELEVLGMLVQGLTNKELADALFISPNTVKRHLKAVYEKLDVHTRAAAVAKAVSSGQIGDSALP
jgi:DNA-binding NarL/FixJ family response regulator